MATKDLTPQLMKGEVWSVNGQRGAVTLPEPINSLDSDSTTAPLAAAQGKALKGIAGGAVSTANEAKAGLDSKADKASNNFTTSLQLKGAGVATEDYVKTADVSNTKIDGKAIKTYIADAVKADGGGVSGELGAVGSVAFLKTAYAKVVIVPGKNYSSLQYGCAFQRGSGAGAEAGVSGGGNAPGTWKALGSGYTITTKDFVVGTLFTRVS